MDYLTNVLDVYHARTDAQHNAGMEWYGNANQLAIDIANGDVWKGAGVIAAYSPLTPWWRNVELATDSLASGIARPDSLGNSVRIAQRIIDGEHPLEVIKGQKTRSFCENIATNGNCDSVTVDVHAFSIAHGTPIPSSKIKLGVKLYRTIADAYRQAAISENIAPSQMQAITWVVWRDIYAPKVANREVP